MEKKLHQKDIIIINVYAPNIRTPKKTGSKTDRNGRNEQFNNYSCGDFNTPLSVTDMTRKTFINIENMNNTINLKQLLQQHNTYVFQGHMETILQNKSYTST